MHSLGIQSQLGSLKLTCLLDTKCIIYLLLNINRHIKNKTNDYMSNTFTLVTIFVQFKSFQTETFIASWCIFTNLAAAMARISWITFVDVFENENRKFDSR